jgi:hypothetical protein
VPDESALRENALDAILSGKLPTQKPSRVYGGPGSGNPCAVCGQTVPQADTEFEIEFDRHGVIALIPNRHVQVMLKFNLHYRCFAAWEFERTKIDVVPGES